MFEAIAAAHNLTTEELEQSLAAAGWDFAMLHANHPDHAGMQASHFEFADKMATTHAERMAKNKAMRAAQRERNEAYRMRAMTPDARANPDFACTRCEGKGRIRGFSHVENGICFGCGGRGVTFPKGGKHAIAN